MCIMIGPAGQTYTIPTIPSATFTNLLHLLRNYPTNVYKDIKRCPCGNTVYQYKSLWQHVQCN